METKVSVIIPVYNVEKYLRECLDSVINQTLKDIEIICVNDGSTDNSLPILKEYAQKDERIKVIDKKNEGVSVARNVGLECANGIYILFLDADDYFESTLIEQSYDYSVKMNSDICIFGANEIDFNNTKKAMWYNSLLVNSSNVSLFQMMMLQTFCWNKMYKLSFLKKYNIKFPNNIKTAEDGIFCILGFINDPKYALLNVSLYNYRKNPDSQTVKNAERCLESDFDAFTYLTNLSEFKSLKRGIKLLIINKFLSGIIYYWNSYPQYRKKYGKVLKEYSKYIFQVCEKKYLETLPNYQVITKNKDLSVFINNNINIAMILDEVYLLCSLCTIYSLKRHKKKSSVYHLFVFVNQVSNVTLRLLNELNEKNFIVDIIEVNNEKYRKISQVHQITNTALIKFNIANLLEDIDKILYLDGDIIVKSDLTDLFSIDIDNFYIAGVRELRAEKYFGYNKLVNQKYYINSGVMLMNLKSFRLDNLEEIFIHTKLNQPKEWKCMDQDVINYVCGGKTKYLSIVYNNPCIIFEDSGISIKEINEFYGTKYRNLRDLYRHSLVLHYAGPHKPWLYEIPYHSQMYSKYLLNCKIRLYKKINFIQQFFSIRNSHDKRHKVITILGIKLKFKKKGK